MEKWKWKRRRTTDDGSESIKQKHLNRDLSESEFVFALSQKPHKTGVDVVVVLFVSCESNVKWRDDKSK